MSDVNPQDVQDLMAGLGRMAAALAHYVEQLEGTGFSRFEAVRIARDWQIAFMGSQDSEE